ncbi:hypothetical protein PC122_g19436 [Phytophthora cactorum]|nr:hypothetical protein PC122_g19436 [Phytophthora cactorum]
MTTNTYDSWGSSAERFADGSICLGIDLGTTNSCVGMWHVDRNHVKILKNRLDRGRTTPSMVRFNPNNQSVDVGNVAIGLETSEPVGNTIRSVKRLMGQKFESKAVDVARIYAAYEVAPTAQGNVAAQVDGKFEVLGIGGDTNLGGEDINNILLDHLLEVLYKRHDVTRAQVEPADMVGLKREVERAKIELSEEEHADITVNDIAGVSKFTHTLTRRKFEQLCDPIWKKCLRIVLSVLKEADVEATDMDEVILVGGSTRIPVLRTKISEAFNGRELCMSVNADEVAGVHHDSEESPMSKVAIFLMGAYILALFGFYLFFRIYFVDERDITA